MESLGQWGDEDVFAVSSEQQQFQSRHKKEEQFLFVPEPSFFPSFRPKQTSPKQQQNQSRKNHRFTLPVQLPCSHIARHSSYQKQYQQSPSERARNKIQSNAKKMLMQQSEQYPHIHEIRLENIRNMSSDLLSQAIQGFYHEPIKKRSRAKTEEKKPKYEESQKTNHIRKVLVMRRSKADNNLWNSRNRIFQELHKQQIQFKPRGEHLQYNTQSHHTVKSILLKANIFKQDKSDHDRTHTLNQQFLSLQQKFKKINERHKHRMTAAAKRLKTQITPKSRGNPHKQSFLEISKMFLPLSESKLLIKDMQDEKQYQSLENLIKSKYFYTAKSHQKHARTQSTATLKETAFKKCQKNDKKINVAFDSRYSSAQSKQLGLAVVKQKISGIFKKIKQARDKQTQYRNYKDMKNNTVHKLHITNDFKEEPKFNYMMQQQRSKLKNHSMKNVTVDLCKLSLMNQKQDIDVGDILSTKNIRLTSNKGRQSKRSAQTISPIFVTEK